MQDPVEGRVGLHGCVEGAGNDNVGDEDVVEFVGVRGVRGEQLLRFVFAADSEADGVAAGEELLENVRWEGGVSYLMAISQVWSWPRVVVERNLQAMKPEAPGEQESSVWVSVEHWSSCLRIELVELTGK